MISHVNTDGSAVSMAHVQQIATASPARAGAAEPQGRWLDEQQTLGVALSSEGDRFYKITRDAFYPACDLGAYTCECKGFQYRASCRHVVHMRGLVHRSGFDVYGAPLDGARLRYCDRCRVNPAMQASAFCSESCRAAAQTESPVVDEADMPVEQSPIYLETRRAVLSDTPFVDECRRLTAERHAAALAAPVGTWTQLVDGAPMADFFS